MLLNFDLTMPCYVYIYKYTINVYSNEQDTFKK